MGDLEISKALELVELAKKTGQLYFTDFLNPLQVAEINKIVSKDRINTLAYGGYEEAERLVLGFSKTEELKTEDFPISIIKLDYVQKFGSVSHRDILGSIIGLGIDRKKLGDIIILLDGAVCLIEEGLAPFVVNNLIKVGKTKVEPCIMPKDYVFFGLNNRVQKHISCASLRVDAIISSVFGLSRSDSAKLLAKGKVFINWVETKNATYSIKEGDMFTLRGFGRFQINTIESQTKNDRMNILITLF